ncbi:hypothetical protein [Bradyrhizobium sp. AZCC 1693]|uniref:hypothetical protein n=1 Tax=Bradyrhizobium sp. AZCC 1693 TaxID=3117029 RepID=UPI002FF0B921
MTMRPPFPGKSSSASKPSGTEERRRIIEKYINSLKELLKRLRNALNTGAVL